MFNLRSFFKPVYSEEDVVKTVLYFMTKFQKNPDEFKKMSASYMQFLVKELQKMDDITKESVFQEALKSGNYPKFTA
jgi:hypothetical protein